MKEELVSLEVAKLLKEKGFDVKFFGSYFISNKGNVFNKKGEELKVSISNRGYSRVMLTIDGKRKKFTIHRLVGELFIHNPEKLPTINHIDGNKQNNDYSNLEWCSYSHNENHAYRTGLKKATWTGIRGSDFPLSIPIICVETGEIFPCLRELIGAKGYTSMSAISAVCKGKRKTVGGLTWRYYKPNDLVKLLIQKGYSKYPSSYEGDDYSCYVSLAQKWLREKHEIYLAVLSNNENAHRYVFGEGINSKRYATWYKTYEEALEEGLKEGLNLIE